MVNEAREGIVNIGALRDIFIPATPHKNDCVLTPRQLDYLFIRFFTVR